jgi:hypothetical protein
MGDLLGPSKTSSGIGKKSKNKVKFKDKVILTTVVVHIWLIVACVGLIAKIVNIFDRRTKLWEEKIKRMNEKKENTVIIDVEAKEVKDGRDD